MNNRRTVLGLLAAAALTLCLSLPGFAPAADAAEASPARKALEVSISRVLDCIKNPDYVNPATRPPLRRQIEDEVYHIFDFGEFSSRTVGPRWKEFSAAQKKSFSNAFADLLLTTYLNKVDGYNGEQVAYTGEIANAAKTRVEVRTEITMKDGTRVPVAYRMMAKDNSWRVYDIIVENLSLVKNYRTQFQDILTSGTPDELIARVKAKAEEVRQAAGRQIAARRRQHASPYPCPAPAADAPVRRARRCRSGRPATEHAPSSLYDSSSPTMPAGAISVHPYAHEQLADGDSLDDYDSEPLTSIADPLEPWNRFWFAFNDIFFLHVAKPVYNFYETVVPQPIRGGVKNFYANILMPKRMINSLLQFRVKEAFVEFGRFCMNTTVGLGGFADVASTKKILVDIDPGGEDFGQTLGRWGIGHGFYIVWPFLGPSSVRESIGFVGDCATDVFFFVHPWELATASELYLRFNALDDLLPTYESLSGIAVDPYIAVREAYIQYREARVKR